MKKSISFFLALMLLLFCLGGCSGYSDVEFTDYFKSYEDFETLEPLINTYFRCVEEAYEESDKSDVTTFNLSEEGKATQDALLHYEIIGSTDKQQVIGSKMCLIYLEVSEAVVHLGAFESIGNFDGKYSFLEQRDPNEPKYFEEIRSALDYAYEEYATYEGE